MRGILFPLLGTALFIALLGVFGAKLGNGRIVNPLAEEPKKDITVGTIPLKVSLADDELERKEGLSGKSSLPEGEGMLFSFDRQNIYPSFWMREMLIPIDIIWIEGGKVTKIDKNIASSLMAGVIGDTGAFRFPGVGVETMKIGIELMKLGADKDNVVFNIYQTIPFNLIKFYGEALSRVEIDKKNKFVWTSVPYEVYSKLSKPESARESTSSLFAQIVEDTEFGFVMVEQEKGKLLISFRSRTGFDTSKIAQKLGGGGHIYASGAKVEGLPFEKAVARVLKVVRSYAKEYLDKQKSSK